MALARPTALTHLFQDVDLTNPQPGDVLTRGTTHWQNVPGEAAAVSILADDQDPPHYWRLTVSAVGALLTEDLGLSPVPQAPLAPTLLAAVGGANTFLHLAWQDNAVDETHCRIERSPNGTTGWAPVATTPASVEAYTDTGLTPETTYYYRVYAVNAVGDSDPTNVVSATTTLAAFSPGDLAPVLWLRQATGCATDLAGTTPVSADGDLVARNADASGAGNHVTQATAGSRPQWRTGANGINGNPCLLFDDVDDALTGGDTGALDVGTGAFTLFVIVQGGGSNTLILAKDHYTGTDNGLYVYRNGASQYSYWNGTTQLYFGAATANARLLAVRRAGPGVNQTRGYLDGALVFTGTDPRTLANTKALTVGDTADGGHSWDGRIMEPCFIAGALSDADFASMTTYYKELAGIA